MAQRVRTREITITEDKGTFSLLFKRLYGESEEYNFEGIAAVRSLLSNEKARLLHTIKQRAPSSVYALAKMVRRDTKSVSKDLKALERFGCVNFIAEKSGKRDRLKPLVSLDVLRIEIRI